MASGPPSFQKSWGKLKRRYKTPVMPTRPNANDDACDDAMRCGLQSSTELSAVRANVLSTMVIHFIMDSWTPSISQVMVPCCAMQCKLRRVVSILWDVSCIWQMLSVGPSGKGNRCPDYVLHEVSGWMTAIGECRDDHCISYRLAHVHLQ
jgi:hypothetical protein